MFIVLHYVSRSDYAPSYEITDVKSEETALNFDSIEEFTTVKATFSDEQKANIRKQPFFRDINNLVDFESVTQLKYKDGHTAFALENFKYFIGHLSWLFSWPQAPPGAFLIAK